MTPRYQSRSLSAGPSWIWPWSLSLLSVVMVVVSTIYLAGRSDWFGDWLELFSFRPRAIVDLLAASTNGESLWLLGGLFSALFLHVDWIHLLGNLAYFWAFGVSVEKAVGHFKFLLLFLILGGAANLYTAWHLYDAQQLPVIGASGGVSAIMGVYLGLFPRRRMGLWLPLGLYLQFARVPALLVIGSWFTLQLLYSAFGPPAHEVAWAAHLAGFAVGLLAAVLLRLLPGTLCLEYRDE